MTKLLSLAAAIGVSFFCGPVAQSMPLAPLEQAQASLKIPVAGGCGPGFHRGAHMAAAVATVTTGAATGAALWWRQAWW